MNEQVRDAREIAEALFKRKQSDAIEEHVIEPAGGAMPAGAGRSPRILSATGAKPPSSFDVERAAVPQPRAAKKRGARIPAAEPGVVRTLATFGMTIRQVAEFYEVPESEIDRILQS